MTAPRSVEAEERLREKYADAEQLAGIELRLQRVESQLGRVAGALETLCQAIEDDALTPKQAASYINMSEASLARWRSEKRKNAPPYERRGKSIRYRRGDLDRWMQENREGAAHDAA